MTEQLTASQKDQLMDKLKQEIAVENVKELLRQMSEKCFKQCIPKPGISLDSSENKCLNFCVDRYIDAWNIVSRTYGGRLQRESGSGFS